MRTCVDVHVLYYLCTVASNGHISLFIVGCLDDLALEYEKSRALQETITVLNGRKH